jgi:DNA-binding transcriptional LysR family regulator
LWDYQTDVAVLAQFTNDPRFHAVPYSRHPVGIFVRTDHPFAKRQSIRIEELNGEPLIMREIGSTTRKALEEALRKADVRPRIVMEIGSREAIREAVIKGLGIGAVSAAEFVPDKRLRLISISNAEIYTYAHVFCLEERRNARIVKAFLDIVELLRKGRTAVTAATRSVRRSR